MIEDNHADKFFGLPKLHPADRWMDRVANAVLLLGAATSGFGGTTFMFFDELPIFTGLILMIVFTALAATIIMLWCQESWLPPSHRVWARIEARHRFQPEDPS